METNKRVVVDSRVGPPTLLLDMRPVSTGEDIRDFFNCGIASCATVESSNIGEQPLKGSVVDPW